MIVVAKNVVKQFMGVNVLDNLSISIESGEHIAMLGANGAGKSTFVRAILGFYHIDGGSIKVNGYNPLKQRVKVLKDISFIPQLPPPIKLSIEELIKYVTNSSNIDKKEITHQAKRLDFDIEENLSKPFFKLSGGMKQKLLIAIALSKKSRLLIFDEPTANLDPKGREKFYELLSELDESCSTLYITHRVEELKGLIDRVIYLDLGKVVEDERI